MSEAVDFQPGTHRELQARRRSAAVELSAGDRLLLDRLEFMFRELTDASDPRRSSPISGQSRYKPVGSEVDEGVATRNWRWMLDMSRKRVSDLVNELQSRLDDQYAPSAPRKEKVRCVNRRCEYANKRQDITFVKVGDSKIQLTECVGCKHELKKAP